MKAFFHSISSKVLILIMNENMETRKLFDNLAKLKKYHGQIYSFNEFEKINATCYDIEKIASPQKEILKNILKDHNIELFHHQGEMIKNILEKKDAYIALNEGSGVSFAIDLGVMSHALLYHKTILYLRSFTSELDSRLEILQKRITKFGWDWIIKAEVAKNAEMFSHVLNKVPDVIITTPEIVKDYLLTQFSIDKESIWFNALNLLLIEDLLLFTPEELCHLKNLISSLTFLQNNHFQIILSSTPIGSPENLAFNITNRTIPTITGDFSNKNAFKEIIWIPYLDSKPTEDNKLQVWRRKYIEELSQCIKALCNSNDVVLIWHLFEPLATSELNKIENDVREAIKSELPKLEITVCDNIRKVPKNKFRSFSKVFILGLSNPYKSLTEILGNLICKDGLAIIIPTENPISYFPIRSKDMLDDYTAPIMLLPEIENVKKHYFLSSIGVFPSCTISKDKAVKIWGKNFMDNIIKELVEKNFLRLENGKIVILNKEDIFKSAEKLKWGILDNEFFYLYLYDHLEGKKEFNFGKYLFPYLIYPGAIYYYGRDKYVVPQNLTEITSELEFNYATEKAPVYTISLLKYSLSKKNEKAELIRTLKGFGQLSFIEDAEIELELYGYRSYESFEYKKSREIMFAAIKQNRRSAIIKYDTKYPSGIAQIIKIFISKYFKNSERLFDVFYDESAVYISSIIPNNENLFRKLFEYLIDIIPKIYEDGYKLLISCPCSKGCPLCLQFIKSRDTTGHNKDETIKVIAKSLEKESEAEFLLKFKNKGLEKIDAQKKYEEKKQEVLEKFKNKLEIEIKDPVPLIVDNLEGASGLYKGNCVIIIPNIPEAFVIEIIAHEYTHNWEFGEGNMSSELMGGTVPYNGKLISEGFAEWIAFKVLDFYGLADYMEFIDLNEYNEYGDGFDLLKWVEDNIAGFFGVIDFVKTAKVLDPENNVEYNLEELLKKSGVGDKIKSRKNKKEDKI